MYFVIAVFFLLVLFFLTRYNKRYKNILIFVNAIICIVYILWRITVIPIDTFLGFLTGGLLFLSEVMGLLQFIFLQYIFSKEHIIKRKTIEDFNGNPPAVDVFICTYNEPTFLLEKTIIGALNLEYDKDKLKIYVCDDGRRNIIKNLCKRLRVNYITRQGNEGAKAGNINNALKNTDSELFAVLDADMICTKNFLLHTVGYFTDENLAFVQTPQVFYNRDMYQRNFKNEEIPNEQDFFMRDIEAGRDIINAVLHVGTNVVFRRSCVEEIGLYPVNSITEDMAVGMLLQAKGYKSLFINEMLVFGLSASTYVDLAIQRDRWCRGNLQVMKHFKPFGKSGLNFTQKIAYFYSFIYWFTCFQKMIYVFSPIWVLCTGIRTMNSTIYTLILFFVPYYLGMILIYNTIAPNTRSLKWAHIYDIAMAPHMCMSILNEIFSDSENKFKVTSKENRDDKSYFQVNVIMPHLIILTCSIFSWVCGMLLFKFGVISLMVYIINMFWSIYNVFGIYVCIRAAYHIANAEKHNEAWIPGGQEAVLKENNSKTKCTMLSLWESGMKIKFKRADELKQGQTISIILKDNISVLATVEEINENDIVILKYVNLTLLVKKEILNIYMEHLRPVFDVKKEQKYC